MNFFAKLKILNQLCEFLGNLIDLESDWNGIFNSYR
jgi:hypothetical protein